MGIAKNLLIEREERGYADLDGNVCALCFTDHAIRAYVSSNAAEKTCEYCGRRSRRPIAVPFTSLMEVIVSGISFDWASPDHEGILYDSAEGGYQAHLTETSELVWGELQISENPKVLDAIIASIDNSYWVERDFYIGSDEDRMRWGWEAFCNEVTHRKRYLFLHQEGDDAFGPEITPAEFLFKIPALLRDLDLIRRVDVGTEIFRVRIGSSAFETAAVLGAPPPAAAVRANRMSPAGIPMFYGSLDPDTAILETFDPMLAKDEQTISVGKFEALRDLTLLDLSNIPEPPSVFDTEGQHLIRPLRFLRSFAADISKPVSRNGCEHIEYVPTQIVTEFFRHIYRMPDGGCLDGLLYRSSREGAHEACVLFCGNEGACDQNSEPKPNTLLRLIHVEQRSAALAARPDEKHVEN